MFLTCLNSKEINFKTKQHVLKIKNEPSTNTAHTKIISDILTLPNLTGNASKKTRGVKILELCEIYILIYIYNLNFVEVGELECTLCTMYFYFNSPVMCLFGMFIFDPKLHTKRKSI